MDTLYAYDVDGILVTKARPDFLAIRLAAQLAQGQAIVCVTGRDEVWLQSSGVTELFAGAFSRYPPRVARVYAENGGMYLEYHHTTGWHSHDNAAFPSLDDLRPHIETAVQRIPGVYFHRTKRKIITVGRDPYTLCEPSTLEKSLAQVGRLFAEFAQVHADRIEHQQTTSAHDLIPRGMTKRRPVEHVLAELGGQVKRVVLFGDAAPADLYMADPVIAANLPYVFYFVGDLGSITPEDYRRYALEVHPNTYAAGVKDILFRLLNTSPQ